MVFPINHYSSASESKVSLTCSNSFISIFSLSLVNSKLNFPSSVVICKAAEGTEGTLSKFEFYSPKSTLQLKFKSCGSDGAFD